ncbi:TetR/AcrR family transcriptional regulator [Kribbella sp. CCNWLW197]|uniref:TetR/AcrR family transcriptional regulator n=1 Tax=Kribbella sp. CCNWLW197 TaxID=3127474 RepID=UPI003076A755
MTRPSAGGTAKPASGRGTAKSPPAGAAGKPADAGTGKSAAGGAGKSAAGGAGKSAAGGAGKPAAGGAGKPADAGTGKSAAGGAGNGRPGRRPGGPDTRGEIVRAARDSFAAKGFTATSIRAIAREAGVDAALVHHYFDSKDELFIESMALPVDPRQVAARIVDGPRDELGRRIATVFLGVWESPDGQQRMKAIFRSVVSSDEVARIMREGITQMIIQPVSRTLDVPDAQLRVTLAATQLIGIAMARYLVNLEPVASVDLATLIDRLGPVLQLHLTG